VNPGPGPLYASLTPFDLCGTKSAVRVGLFRQDEGGAESEAGCGRVVEWRVSGGVYRGG
jgi:hypothetical protein